MAHDFNNILTAVAGFTSVAQLKLDKKHPVQDYLQEILKASNRAAELTSHLLAFSRKQVINPEVLNINDICEGLRKILQRLIGEDVRFEMNLGRDLPAVYVDRGQIGQVIINLTVNARDAMPEGGSLFIETSSVQLDQEYCIIHPEVKPGLYVMFSVRDTGQGIPGKYLDKIFEPFFTSKEIGKGTGLGLAMVYGAITQNGESIDVLSEEGKGTTFRCYLPESESVEKAEPVPEEQLKSYSGHETIILVEDDPMVSEMAELILTQQGYSVRSFSSPDNVLSFINKSDVKADLLLTDVVLPGMDGVQLAKKVEKFFPVIKVLYTSGYAENRIVKHGHLKPRVNLAMKPWNMSDFLRMIRETLDG
jgi:CheY-like chemotaxis protein